MQESGSKLRMHMKATPPKETFARGMTSKRSHLTNEASQPLGRVEVAAQAQAIIITRGHLQVLLIMFITAENEH